MEFDRRNLWMATVGSLTAVNGPKPLRQAPAEQTPLVTAGFAGARRRGLQDKIRDSISVADAPDVDLTGRRDSSAGFNLATGAVDVYSTALWRGVSVPAGRIRIGNDNAAVYVRKGQSLIGAGLGATTLDLTGALENSRATMVLGGSAGGDDPGGQAVELASMTLLGGPAQHPSVTTSSSGWSVHDVFFTGPGVGLAAGGSDGLLQRCIFDLGLIHLVVTAKNMLASGNIHYQGSYQITLKDGSSDVNFSECQFEYFTHAAILFADNSLAICNIAINNCNFIQNEQYSTSAGAIYIRSHRSDLMVSSSRFRNLRGFGIAYGAGVGNRIFVSSCIFDGRRTSEPYNQSNSMGGIDASNIEAKIQGCLFSNLGGQPILLGGDEATTWVIQGCHFSGNTGGSSEIRVTNRNPRSRLVLMGCTGSGRPLVNTQSVVPVVMHGCDEGVGGPD